MKSGSWATAHDMELIEKLRAHVAFLASPQLKGRKPGTPGNYAAADYIAAQFQDINLDPLPSVGSYFQHISSTVGDNLIGVRHPSPDSQSLSRWLLLGAHFDHLGESGGEIYFGAVPSTTFPLDFWPSMLKNRHIFSWVPNFLSSTFRKRSVPHPPFKL
jgi:hypothetical protein